MKKTVYTLCVDQYMPDLCALTLPNHAEYAERIGADFQIITKRWLRLEKNTMKLIRVSEECWLDFLQVE